jgi:hypothetical protein
VAIVGAWRWRARRAGSRAAAISFEEPIGCLSFAQEKLLVTLRLLIAAAKACIYKLWCVLRLPNVNEDFFSLTKKNSKMDLFCLPRFEGKRPGQRKSAAFDRRKQKRAPQRMIFFKGHQSTLRLRLDVVNGE